MDSDDSKITIYFLLSKLIHVLGNRKTAIKMIKIESKSKDEEKGERENPKNKRKKRNENGRDFEGRRRKRRKDMETGLSCFSFLPNKIESTHKQNKSKKTKIKMALSLSLSPLSLSSFLSPRLVVWLLIRGRLSLATVSCPF